MDNQGRLIPRYKIRTKRKVIRTIVDKMAEYADHQTDYNGKCYTPNATKMPEQLPILWNPASHI